MGKVYDLERLILIMKELGKYESDVNNANPAEGIITREWITTGKNHREVTILSGNEAALVGVAIRILHTLTLDEGWYKIDKITGILDENTEELVITTELSNQKKKPLEKY